MRAVWSFWSKPWWARSGGSWSTERHHLLAWVLSVESARRHYSDTMLVTDEGGARMLVDQLGLKFSTVSTELEDLAEHDPILWMTGKLRAYRAQDVPFVHLDTDVFLWQPLPESLSRAAVFAQHPEPFWLGASNYRPEQLSRTLTQHGGRVPPEWEWSLSFGEQQRGECCGILGGSDLAFIQYYADTALQLMKDPRNRLAWSHVTDKGGCNILIEQYHLAACVEFHRERPDSPFYGVGIRYLFNSPSEAYNPNVAAKVGYTHLLSNAKQSAAIMNRLESRVARDYSTYYERCLRWTSR